VHRRCCILVPAKSNLYTQTFKVKSLTEEIVSPKNSQVKLKGHVRGLDDDEEGLFGVLFKLESSLDVLFCACDAAAKERRKGSHVQILFKKMKKIFRRAETIQANCDVKATNIILQGLPQEVYALGDDAIDAINHMMSFLTAVVTSRYPATNNHLRTSSNPRQQATINNGRVTIQPIQGRKNYVTAGSSRPYASGYARASDKQRVIVCYNYKGEGHMSKQCTKPKRKRDAEWFKDKMALMGNLSHYGSDNLTEVVQIVLWYLDSGCSKHMTEDRTQLINFVQKFLGMVKFKNDHVAKIMGHGDYQIGNVTISRVYYVEGLGHNLFSIGQFCDLDLEVAFRQHTCFIRNLDGVDLLTGSQGNNIYTMSLQDMMASSLICFLSKASKTKPWLWHRRLSHLNFGVINHLARQGLVKGLLKLKFEKDHLCPECAMGKSTKKTHKPKSEDTNQEKLYLLHMDLCGPIRIESVNRKKYILMIVNDFSQFTWVKFLRSKDEAPDFIIKFLKMIQVRLKVSVRRIRTDNGTEFVNQTLRDYDEEVGISHEISVARSPQQNGVVERRNRILIEATHRKLQPKADIGIFIGYAPTKKAFRIYNRRSRRIVETIHVDFDELTAMAFEHHSSGPILHEMTLATISSGLVTMETTFEQQVVMDEALVPSAQRNILHICPRVQGQTFAELPFEEEILDFIELTNEEIRNSKAYKEYYAIATGKAAPKPKASARRIKSGFDTSITPLTTAVILRPTAATTPRLTAAVKGKQTAKASKAKKEELSWNSTDDEGADDEGKDGDDDEEDERDDDEEGKEADDDANKDGDAKDDVDEDQEVAKHDDKDDNEESRDDDEEGENSEDEDNGEEDLDLNIGKEERHDDEEEEDELYRDVNINQGRGLQGTLEVEDTHITLTLTPTSVAPLPMTIPIKVSIQIQSDRLHKEAQRDNDEFHRTVDENIRKIIKEQVKEQVKVQVSKILPRIEQAVNEQLEAEVLTRSSHSSRTSYAVAADLSEIELKKILIEKIEAIKSVTLKRKHDDAGDNDEEPSARPDRGSKRCREGKEPESASTPSKTATKSASRSTTGSRYRQASTSESAFSEEPVQTTSQIEEPSYSEFETGADDQPIISELAKQADTRSSFNELMDTPLDFSNFIMNQLRVDTLTPELLFGLTYDLVKGSCKSLIELEYHLEEVYKATTDQLDWVNPEGQQYPHNLLQPLPLIPDNQGRRVIPFAHFINNNLEYLRGGAFSCKYTTLVTKTKAADYEHIKWIKDLMPRTMWIQEPIDYDKHALWGKKLNLTKLNTYRSDLKRKEAYTAYSNPRGFIYQNKDKQNRLMRIDELHKFSDGMLTDVHTTLDDRLKGIQMQYLPQTIWRRSDKDRAVAMIQAINKRLKTRRVMRSLERFVRGRLYERDFRML
nr:retrovirus-related Pol polyprotein from transposon TNT 1-94 [Tanacetum cinerariifolium]